MKLGLGLGLLSQSSRPALSGEIPGVGEDPPGDFIGHEIPPTIQTVGGNVVIGGKTKQGFEARIVVPLGALVTDKAYNVDFVANFSGLALGGAKAGVGYGFKTGNSFRLVLLQGNGVATRVTTVTGQNPNGWNKNTGHTVTDGGAPENGTQHAADIQLVTNADGTAYDFSTSGDDQANWDEELADQPFAPFANISQIESGACLAARFSADDAGQYSITVTWVEEDAELWTPAEISTLQWYDFSDANNVTLTGSLIDQADDLSGQGNHATQGTETNKPTYDTVTNIIDGKAVMTCDGNDNFLAKSTLVGFPANNSTPITVALVARFRTTAAQNGIFDYSSGTLTNTTALALNTTTTPQMVLRASGTANAATSAVSSFDTSVHLWSFVVGAAERRIFKNGAATGTPSTTNNGNQNWTNFRIGRLFQDVLPTLGDYGEYVVFSGVNTTNRQLIEGYLAWKWGLEGSLDSGHPYKNAAPTV